MNTSHKAGWSLSVAVVLLAMTISTFAFVHAGSALVFVLVVIAVVMAFNLLARLLRR